jgi:pyrroloquinoline quinone biosynthesis protein B
MLILLYACQGVVHEDVSTTELADEAAINESPEKQKTGVELVVLGNVQDAGSPQINCQKECCRDLFQNPNPTRKVVSLGIVDHALHETYLLEATPDMVSQLNVLRQHADFATSDIPNGVFLTHAHIGHYTGLMYFGKEAMNANQVPVFAMPRMASFLQNNGPWSQLVTNENILLNPLIADRSIQLNAHLSIRPILVPHRDEFSETVGFLIEGPQKSALFIPDIDKWNRWGNDEILQWIEQVDYAFLDATFYDGDEIKIRDMSEIPHPFVVESFETFDHLSSDEKAKIHFIHFNHTNPLLIDSSEQSLKVHEKGYNVAQYEEVFLL